MFFDQTVKIDRIEIFLSQLQTSEKLSAKKVMSKKFKFYFFEISKNRKRFRSGLNFRQ